MNLYPGGTGQSRTAYCPAGKVVGGGFDQGEAGNSQANSIITESRPINGNAWRVYARYTAETGAGYVTVHAICMTTDPSAVIATASRKSPGKKHGK